MMIRHGFFSGTRASLPESPTALAFTHRLDRELADPKVCASPTPSNECLAGEHLGRWVTGAFITCAANAEDDRKVSDDQLRGLAEIVAELAPIADAEDLFLSAQALEVSLRATGHFTPDDCQKVRELIRQASQD